MKLENKRSINLKQKDKNTDQTLDLSGIFPHVRT